MSKRPFVVTIDVEAVPQRADKNHVETLIYGDFGGGNRAGILEMMEAADEVDVPLTMFLDLPEVELHGESIEEVGQRIVSQGHELQLHLHPNFLPNSYWYDRGVDVPGKKKRWVYEKEAVDIVMHDFTERMNKIRGSVPEAYRAGAFQVSYDWLESAKDAGISISSNHNYASFVNQKRSPLAEPDAGLFQWDNGIIEVPVTQVQGLGQWRPLTFPIQFEDDRYGEILLKSLASENNKTPVVVLLHSWSLLRYSGVGRRFNGVAPHKVSRFKRLLEYIAKNFEPQSISDLKHKGCNSIETRKYPIRCDNI